MAGAVLPPLRGHLHQHEDGTLEGWCWAPDRPDERLVVEILVNDRVVVGIVAAMFRRDVLAQGYGDGCHGFAVRLPPDLGATGECLITARERVSRRIFGRALRRFPGADDRLARLADTEGAMEAAREQAAALLRLQPAHPMRAALRELAGVLAARAGVQRPAEPLLHLPSPRSPALGLVLVAAAAAPALRQIAALAPALEAVGAEILLLDPGADPKSAWLPRRVRNLRYLYAPEAATPGGALALAAAHLDTPRLLLLAPPESAAEPSAAALLALARGLAEHPAGCVIGPRAASRLGAHRAPVIAGRFALPAPLGLLAGVERALWRDLAAPSLVLPADLGAAAVELALRTRLLGHSVLALSEPASPVRLFA